MAEYPDVIVQVAWTTDPRTRPADPGGWTTVSADVDNPPRERLKVRRGLNMKANTIEAGTADIVLDNTNRDLDDSNTASTYYPNVKPRRRIRVRFDPPEGGEEVRDIFTGFVERWQGQWSMDDAWVKVEASDLIALIADEILPPSVLQSVTEGLSPSQYWPLAEDFGQTADDIVGDTSGRYNILVLPGDPAAPYLPGPSATFSRSTDERQFVKILPLAETAPTVGMSLVQWVRPSTSSTNGEAVTWKQSEGPDIPDTASDATYAVLFGLAAAGADHALEAVMKDGTITDTSNWGGSSLWDGKPHMIGVTVDPTATPVDGEPSTYALKVYVDGVRVGPQATLDADLDVEDMLTGITGPGVAAIGHGIDVDDDPITIGHTAHWSGTVLTDANMAAIWEAGSEAWSGDRTGERLGRILDLLGIDANDRDIATGVEVCGPTVLGEQNAVEYLRKIAATEQSPLFVSGDGKVTFPGQLSNAPTIAETFDDNDAVTAVRFVNVDLDFSLDRVINQASVKREGGNTQTAIDADSQDDYGILNGGLGVIETLHRDPSGPRALASSLVIRNHEPKTIISSLDIDGRDEDSTVAACLDLEIGEAARVKATHPGGGSQISQDCFIERVEQTMSSPLQWQVTYGLSEFVTLPAFAWDTAGQGWDESVWSEPPAPEGGGSGGFLLLISS